MQMLESGPGFTLSGKLLDPYCASARAYGLKPPVVARECPILMFELTHPKTFGQYSYCHIILLIVKFTFYCHGQPGLRAEGAVCLAALELAKLARWLGKLDARNDR